MKQHRIILLIAALAILAPFWYGSIALAQAPCTAPDNGGGTVDLPANCPYTAPYGPMLITEGLPPNTTIELEPILMNFICSDPPICTTPPLPPGVCEAPGGSMGGHYQCFEATLDLTVSGTGDLAGFNRHLAVPVMCEIHTGSRNPGDPVQTFSTVMYRLSGELFGDPDFCTFRVTAGADYGLPSPGETTLEDLGGGLYNIDSFFDITYQIEFEGCPGSILQNYAGTTTAMVRLKQGSAEDSPTGACCRSDGSCLVSSETYCQAIGGTYYGDDSECLGDGDDDGLDDLCFIQGTCLAPDNGGTVDLPADCPYTAPDEPMYIIDGLPPNTTIELEPIFEDFFNIVRTSGGWLGGQIQQFDATLDLTVSGTGDLAGFNRHLAVPVSCEVHTGPRNSGDPVQTFPSVMFKFQGELYGDPDFCTFRIRAGNDFGLPSSGYFTLTEQSSDYFTVDSFFDVMYQIEFEGCPASVLEDYSGTTTASVRLKQGSGDAQTPPVGACCELDGSCSATTETFCGNLGGVYLGDGTVCSGDGDGDGYDDSCYPQGTCLDTDNGSGTVDLPADCPYTAPYEPMRIIDGLPPNTTIELEPILMDFICSDPPICTTPPLPPGVCEALGGSMGGHYQCFEATLDLTVSGTGDLAGYSRHLAVPVMCEIHTGSRNPGDPVQSFPTVMYRLSGELFGDPDFCTFRVTGGTDYGLPSPGHTTLEDLGGGLYNIDSFFDITYQIEFEGCPASPLEDYAGTTTATIRLKQGSAEGSVTGACCKPDGSCMVVSDLYCQSLGGTYYGDDSICLGDDDGDGYDDLCYEPGTCLAPDNGSATVDLPADCPYIAPDEPMQIIDGLPPGTTIELVPVFEDFFCSEGTNCSLTMPQGNCEDAGGSLGGHYHCFEGALYLDVSGTGSLEGFSRNLAVPIFCEVHTASRNPGESVQTFPAVMYRFSGELFGDPDFCMFRIRAGTDYGLQSPGQMMLTDLGNGIYNVDSFFDITYQIEFEGCPDSYYLGGYSGTTTATIRLKQGSGEIPQEDIPTLSEWGMLLLVLLLLAIGTVAVVKRRKVAYSKVA